METKTNDDYIREFDIKFYPEHEERGLTSLRNDEVGWLRTLLASKDKEREAAVKDIIKMADKLEHECGKDGDKGLEQWKAFKGFRNTIRNKYLIEKELREEKEIIREY